MSASKRVFARALRVQSPSLQSSRCARLRLHQRANFHTTPALAVVKPFLLADIGEGITECQLIQWFVQPGARVEQFDKICEVQSDKASVEITSPFDGVIKKLHYEPDDMAITGKPLVDIDIQSEITPEDEAKLADGPEDQVQGSGADMHDTKAESRSQAVEQEQSPEQATEVTSSPTKGETTRASSTSSNGTRLLATPAVRHLIREHGLNIEDIDGTGKDGRVLKEDVHRHVAQQQGEQAEMSARATEQIPIVSPGTPAAREDRKITLTPVQNQMFKAMTRSLSIPHFLYSTSADMTAVTSLRKKLNATTHNSAEQKLTHLPFIMKAISLALLHHPLLNAHLNSKDPKKPELTYKGAHNFGVAVDSPSGLVVPVVRNVQDLSISEIAQAIRAITLKARENRLAPGDLSGNTFTVSNVGSVGGGVVAPVISEPQVAIVGVGRSKNVPAFNENDELIKREEVVFSWSADHRVVDGAECARCAERVKAYLEDPATMLAALR